MRNSKTISRTTLFASLKVQTRQSNPACNDSFFRHNATGGPIYRCALSALKTINTSANGPELRQWARRGWGAKAPQIPPFTATSGPGHKPQDVLGPHTEASAGLLLVSPTVRFCSSPRLLPMKRFCCFLAFSVKPRYYSEANFLNNSALEPLSSL